MIKSGMEQGVVKGIRLRGGERQQVSAQFANDTSFTLLGEERLVKETIGKVDQFCCGSGLVLN